MSADRSTLRNLVEMLEDGREFYDEAARLSTNGIRRLYQEKARHHAVTLAEIRQWLAGDENGADHGDDEYAVFLDRIYVLLCGAPPAGATAGNDTGTATGDTLTSES